MRILLCAALLVSVALVSGCAVYPNSAVVAPLTLDQKGPVAGFDSTANVEKEGSAKAEGILIVGYGDASIKSAAADAGITKIHHVDQSSMNVFGIYAKYETIVYGE